MHQIATDQGLMSAPVDVSARVEALAPSRARRRGDRFLPVSRDIQLVLENDGVAIMEFRVARGSVQRSEHAAATRAPADRQAE